MKLDYQRIIQKTGFIKEQTSALRRLVTERAKDDILQDPWILKGIKYSLQTGVEACIDLAYHICAKELGQAPVDARDSFKRLAAGGIISDSDVAIFSAMIGFRNRVVHGYQEVSSEQIYQIIENDLGDLDKFGEMMLELVRRKQP